MVTLPHFLAPRPIREIDAGNNWQAGFDHVLEAGETGYLPLKGTLSETLTKEFTGSPFPTVDEVELLDGHRGFSALERSLADRFIRGFHKWNRVYAQPHREALKNDRYTRPENPEPETFLPHYWSVLKSFFVGPERLELTEENLQTIWETLASGLEVGLGRSRRIVLPETASETPSTFGCVANLFSRPGQTGGEAQISSKTRGAALNDGYIVGSQFRGRFSLPDSLPTDFFLTQKDLMFDHLYGPLGYYETGGPDDIPPYLSLVDSLRPAYSWLITWKIFRFYQGLKSKGKIGDEEPFIIYEHGGGDGNLARDILAYCQEMAKDPKSGDWRLFWKNLKYRPNEIAADAVARQRDIETLYPGKFTVTEADAITYRPPEKGKGVALSVLLLDSFPLHEVAVMNGEPNLCLSLPAMSFPSAETREGFIRIFFPKNWRDVLRQSKTIQEKYLGLEAGDLHVVFFSRDHFRQFQASVASFKKTNRPHYDLGVGMIQMRTAFLRPCSPLRTHPDLARRLGRDPRIAHLSDGEDLRLSDDIDAYIQNLGQNYFTTGAFFTLDLMNLISMITVGGQLTVKALLTAQRAEFRVGIDRLEAPDFGRMVVYQGLDDAQISAALNRAGGFNVEIKPQGALWKSTPLTRDRAVKAIAERVRKATSPTIPLPKSEDEIREIMSLMDDPFKGYGYVFATFDTTSPPTP